VRFRPSEVRTSEGWIAFMQVPLAGAD